MHCTYLCLMTTPSNTPSPKRTAGAPLTPSPVSPPPLSPQRSCLGLADGVVNELLGSPKRWTAATPSQEALVQRSQQEQDNAEAFICKVRNTSDKKVATLVKADVLGRPTGRHIEPGESFDVVARCHRQQDGRAYLRLGESLGGWVSTRSRKEYWKVVLAAETAEQLEPGDLPH